MEPKNLNIYSTEPQKICIKIESGFLKIKRAKALMLLCGSFQCSSYHQESLILSCLAGLYLMPANFQKIVLFIVCPHRAIEKKEGC